MIFLNRKSLPSGIVDVQIFFFNTKSFLSGHYPCQERTLNPKYSQFCFHWFFLLTPDIYSHTYSMSHISKYEAKMYSNVLQNRKTCSFQHFFFTSLHLVSLELCDSLMLRLSSYFWSVLCHSTRVILLWLVCCKISKTTFDQRDAIQYKNPYTSVKLQDNLMSCILKWSKRLYFCVIWKNLLCGVWNRQKCIQPAG